MGVNFLRIDDRLIHGQVVTAWVKNYQAKRILIVDEGVSKDEFLKGVLKMVAPAGVELQIIGTEYLSEIIEKYESDAKNTIILVKTPQVAKALFDAGLKLDSLNVGGMGICKGRINLYKNVSASPEEISILKGLEDSGIKVYFQAVPSDRQVLLGSTQK